MVRIPLVLSLALSATALSVPVVAAVTPATATVPSAAVLVDPDPANRESMRQGYLEILKPAMQVPIGWTGNLATCNAGAPSAAAQQATLTAVNYFRDLVGSPSVTFDAAMSAKAQQAALMMARNNALDHFPDDTWDCYTADGYDGASHSNLYLGVTGARSIAGYMVDPGEGNTAAGHRRWVIDPRLTKMGSGSVDDGAGRKSNALYVVGGPTQAPPAATPDFMPWPVAGYLPVQIEPNGRWSLSAKGAVDFSAATVKVNGSSAGVTVHEVTDGYGPNTLVWNFNPDFQAGDPDRTYQVTVSGIQGAPVSTYSYAVTLFDAEADDETDSTPPEIHPVGKSFRVALDGFSMSWTVMDTESGVDGMQQWMRTRTPDSGYTSWPVLNEWDGSTTSTWTSQPSGQTTCLSRRARDAAGNISEWTAASCIHTPLDDVGLTPTSAWKSVTSTGLWFGSAFTTKKSGARLTLPGVQDADRLGIVATRCPRCGKVGVYVGTTKAGVIRLAADDFETQNVLLLPRQATSLDGKLRLVVESTDKRVQIDGVVVSGPPPA